MGDHIGVTLSPVVGERERRLVRVVDARASEVRLSDAVDGHRSEADMDRSVERQSPLFAGRTLEFHDEDSGYRFVAASPSAEPDLWSELVSGALTAYRKYGVEVAIEYDKIIDGGSTTYFFAALDADGVVVGGSRALGPYRSADDAHPMVEWSDPVHRSAIRRVLGECLPHGLVESKMGWVAAGVPRRRQLSAAVARTTTYCMELLGARYLVGTAADNALEMWTQCGARIIDDIPPCPYPDSRYRTRLLLWDVRESGSCERTRELEKLLSSEVG
ncbi:hypothetical protein [Rhodococcus artemisiae]|uniref:N-acetyltransferase domain-containing protein n=1 Tax=Rhodococcus artemisiae TaxID=714159 RepID=A0ABU7LDR0_9NOCA|nr:hypothetical protein [Rhodococcus artemisiae]MEE2059650.1 hypothetical protein [Rhodococcus artemisiae]